MSGLSKLSGAPASTGQGLSGLAKLAAAQQAVAQASAPSGGGRRRGKKKGKSIWGHLADPFVNTGHAIAGIPGGLLGVAEAVGTDVMHHPTLPLAFLPTVGWEAAHGHNPFGQTTKKVVIPLGQSYRRKYGSPVGKIVHGHPLGGLQLLGTRMFVDDPLGTAGDIATALTLGTAGAVRVGMLGKLSEADKAITLRSGDLGAIRKPLAGRTEFSARARLRTDKTLKGIDARRGMKGKAPLPVIGEQSRYGRAALADEVRILARHTSKAMPYLKARRGLSDAEAVAVDVMHDFPLKKSLDKYKAELKDVPEAKDTLALLDNPKVMEAYNRPTEKMGIFLDESKKLGEHSSALAKLLPDTVLHRRYMPMLVQRGARIEHDPFTHLNNDGSWNDLAKGKRAYTEQNGVGRVVGYDPETDMVTMDFGGSQKITKEAGRARYAARTRGEDVPPPAAFTYNKEVPLSALRDPTSFKLYPPQSANAAIVQALQKASPTSGISHAERIDGLNTTLTAVRTRLASVKEMQRRGVPDDTYMNLVSSAGREIKWDKFPSKEAAVEDYFTRAEANVARKLDEAQAVADAAPPEPARLEVAQENRVAGINRMIDQIKKELHADGRPEPLYRPHTAAVHDINPSPYAGGGVGPTQGKVVRQSKGFLLGKGRVLYGKDTLAPMYMRVVRREMSKARHVQLLKAGRLVDAGTSLAELEAETGQKWRYVRQTAGDRPSYIEMSDAEFADALDTLDVYKKGERMHNDLEDELTTTNEDSAFVTDGENVPEAPGGLRVVVPDKLVKQVAGEFQRSTHNAAKAFRGVTNAWRTLVLNLRLGWLVNNVVGNTGLYFLQNTGPGALRSLIKGDLTADDIAATVAEHGMGGTAYGSQMPAAGKIGRALEKATTVPEKVPVLGGRALTRAPEVLRNMDIRYEQKLRRATIDRALNASPELKAMTKDIKNQTKTMREMKVELLKKNPKVADKASAEAYRTLGNFNNLSPFEQNVVRQVVPFYAWYRAITKIAFHLPLDNPYRTAILAAVGNEGFKNQAQVGSGIQGAIQLPGGYILRTAGVNPLMTIPQTVGAVSTMARAGLGNIPGLGIKAPSQRATAFAAGIGNPLLGFPLTGGLSHTIRFLPETRVLNPPGSSTYAHTGRTWQAYLEELGQWAGVPIRQTLAAQGGHPHFIPRSKR